MKSMISKVLFIFIFMSLFIAGVTRAEQKQDKEKDVEAKLLHASSEGNLKLVKKLVTSGADINAKDKQGEVPLHKASLGCKNAKVVKYLILKGANVNANETLESKYSGAKTPLHFAASNRCNENAAILISAGADVNARDSWGKVPLHTAAYLADYDTVFLLLKNNAEVKIKDRNGQTPLHSLFRGTYSGQSPTKVIKIAKLLIDLGNGLDDKDASGKTPLDICENSTVKKYFSKDLASFTTFDAIELNDLKLFKKLVKSSNEANIKNKEGYSILQMAAKHGLLPFVKYLKEKRADINYVYRKTKTHKAWGGMLSVMEYVETPLILALKERHWNVAGFLVENGADVNLVGKTLDTLGFILMQGEIVPLTFAARFGQKELVRIMIMKGADVNMEDSSGNTALMEAAEGGYMDIVKLLVSQVANISIKNEKEMTAQQLAKKNGHLHIVTYFESLQKKHVK